MKRRNLLTLEVRGAARRFIAQRPATEGSGLDRSVRGGVQQTGSVVLHSDNPATLVVESANESCESPKNRNNAAQD